MKMRLTIAALALLLPCVPLFAQQTAVIKQLTGKVQLKHPGAEWINAAPGATVGLGTIVSTGFNSTAVLDLGTSEIQVRPLTRLRLDELLRNANKVTTNVFLTVGEVHASVEHLPSLIQSFTLQSPVSTAAVRGTQFTYAGSWVETQDGVVRFTNSAGFGRDVSRGQGSELAGSDLPVSPSDYRAEHVNVNPFTGPFGEAVTASPPATNTGTIVVTVQ